MARLIITNGDAAAELLRTACPDAEVLPWRDILFEGPVPAGLNHTDLSALRARYLSATYTIPGRDFAAEFRARDAMLARHEAFDEVVLVFEHDLADTLQVLQLLDWFDNAGRDLKSLRLVQASRYLTETADQLASLVGSARPPQRQQVNRARRAWAAFRWPTPELWFDMLHADRNFKNVWLAVLTLLGHLPLHQVGITHVDKFILKRIGEGRATPTAVFDMLQAHAHGVGGKYMGDWSIWMLLDRLAFAKVPLFEGLATRFPCAGSGDAQRAYRAAPLDLSAFGQRVLDGRADHAAINMIDYWLGGTHLTNDSLWRIDRSHRLLYPPERSIREPGTRH